jgi:hypothetical protein
MSVVIGIWYVYEKADTKNTYIHNTHMQRYDIIHIFVKYIYITTDNKLRDRRMAQ